MFRYKLSTREFGVTCGLVGKRKRPEKTPRETLSSGSRWQGLLRRNCHPHQWEKPGRTARVLSSLGWYSRIVSSGSSFHEQQWSVKGMVLASLDGTSTTKHPYHSNGDGPDSQRQLSTKTTLVSKCCKKGETHIRGCDANTIHQTLPPNTLAMCVCLPR